MASQLDLNTFQIWTSKKLRETLPMMSPCTLSEFVSDDPFKVSVCPLVSPKTNVLVLKTS